MRDLFKSNKNLVVIAVIALVNALGYGIIIPILYTYSHKFGLTDFQNGLLFSLFSLCQFIATPLIGRLSDKYGRKPLLIISITGTALSFLLMAFAKQAWMIFVARALDGITAGNIPVASAVISDTTEPKDRARGFGIIGASFGFGFVVGPAISGLTLPFGETVPFLIAAAISIIAVIMTWIMLPETNKHLGEVKKAPLFDFHNLVHALFDKAVGKTLAVTLIYTIAFGLFIYAYQPFSVKTLGLTPNQIAINFSIFGLVGLISQAIIIPRVTKAYGDARSLVWSLCLSAVTFFALYFVRSLPLFILVTVVNGIGNAFVNPLTQALLSKEVDAKSQGTMLGVSASYMSIGLIIGPIIGGFVAQQNIPLPFIVGALIVLTCIPFALQLQKMHLTHKEHAF